MIWSVPRIWQGGEVWILGGGPSVTKQFGIPDSIVRQVMSKVLSPSAYSPYLKSLHDKHVIGINVAYQIGNWIDMVFFGDDTFFNTHYIQLAKFPGLKVACHDIVKATKWVKYVPRDASYTATQRKHEGLTSNPASVRWNFNSGAAAINIAANAGAKRIFLLGFDMKNNEKNDQHWHDVYNRRDNPVHVPFATHLRGFPQIAKDAKARGIEIINCNPDSAITVFPKINVKDVLK